MTIKKKLSLGLGFLFLIIFVLVFFCSFKIGKLTQDADNILRDNYKSLSYAKNMTSALEVAQTAMTSLVFSPAGEKKVSEYYSKVWEGARVDFETNLRSENNNITEINEKAYVDALNTSYTLYSNLCLKVTRGAGGASLYFSELQPALQKLEQAINNITDINMQAVERKSQMAKNDSARIISSMAVVGILCLILAFAYFWYFPFYVSNSISYLSTKIKGLLDKAGLALDIRTDDETQILLQAINLLENKLAENNLGKEPRRPKGLRRGR